MDPGYLARPALYGIKDVAEDHHHRHTIAEGIVDTHCGVLRADCAVTTDERRFAGDLRVTVSHRRGEVFIGGQNEFRILVAAVIDDRFLQRHVCVCRNAEHVFKSEALDDIDHEVGPGPIDRLRFINDQRGGRCGRPRQYGRAGVSGGRRSLLSFRRSRLRDSQGRTRGRSL